MIDIAGFVFLFLFVVWFYWCFGGPILKKKPVKTEPVKPPISLDDFPDDLLTDDQLAEKYKNKTTAEEPVTKTPTDPDLDDKIFKLERKIKEETIFLKDAQGMIESGFDWRHKRDHWESSIKNSKAELANLKSQKTT